MNTAEDADSPTAIALFQDAVRRRPKSSVAAYLLGQAYALRQDTAGAIEWFDRAMALPPGRNCWQKSGAAIRVDKLPMGWPLWALGSGATLLTY